MQEQYFVALENEVLNFDLNELKNPVKNEILNFHFNKLERTTRQTLNFDELKTPIENESLSLYLNEIEKTVENEIVVKSIYFGGGTPSFVNPIFIEKIMKIIRNKFKVDENAEITIECNPNSVDESKLKTYKNIGINRLSIGMQSFNVKALSLVGRVQSSEKLKEYKKNAIKILKLARAKSFANISADFILGLPSQRKSAIKLFLKRLSKLVTHFSCYMLTVEQGTKLAEILPDGVDDDKLACQYRIAVKTLKKLGFERYEISNFARSGYKSAHNMNYWQMGEYLGFGLAAHSFYGKKRIANTENLLDYINFYSYSNEGAEKEEDKEKIIEKTEERKMSNLNNKSFSLEKDFNVKTIEFLDDSELAEETIMLTLRTQQGLDLLEFKNKYYDLESKKRKTLATLLNTGFIEFENNFLRLSDKGHLLANKIILELID
jgi:oxygen-independent coproporphyrinogen-3 oxidase